MPTVSETSAGGALDLAPLPRARPPFLDDFVAHFGGVSNATPRARKPARWPL